MAAVYISGAIEASTVYAGKGNADTKVADNATVKLPAVTRKTVTISAMGDIDLPLPNSFEDMETSVTKVGLDDRSGVLGSANRLEYRWVQDVIKADGSVQPVGCKAFMNVSPVTVTPDADVEVGSTSENEHTFKVTRYKLVIDGKEVVLLDRLAGVFRVNGRAQTDYSRWL